MHAIVSESPPIEMDNLIASSKSFEFKKQNIACGTESIALLVNL